MNIPHKLLLITAVRVARDIENITEGSITLTYDAQSDEFTLKLGQHESRPDGNGTRQLSVREAFEFCEGFMNGRKSAS